MFRKIFTIFGAIVCVFIFYLIGAFIGMAIGGNIQPLIEFNGAVGYEAGGQIGGIVGLVIGLFIGFRILKKLFSGDGKRE